MKIDKTVFEAYSREIYAELSEHNTKVCKIKHDKVKHDYYLTEEGKLIKAVQEIENSTPLINSSVLNNRMQIKTLANIQSSVIYNKLVIFSVKTDDYEGLKEMVLEFYKQQISKFYE